MFNRSGIIICLVLALSGLAACKKNPVDRLTNNLENSGVPQTSGIFIIYDEELKTGGGAGLIPGGENQSINFKDASSPRRNVNHLRYQWTGGDVTNNGTAQHLFAGFSLPITAQLEQIGSANARDLSAAGYTTLKFFVRGTLSSETTLRIEGPDDGTGGLTPTQINSGTDFTLTNDWQEITMTISSPSAAFASVKTFMTVTFQYSQPPRTTATGGGGVVYFDDIRFD